MNAPALIDNAPVFTRNGTLPSESSSFIDRRMPLAAARAALADSRLLSIIGPGGVGKTRFAVRLARNAQKFYPDGVWFIDLSRVSESGSVVDEVSRSLDVKGEVGDQCVELIGFFGSRHGLLVLDNCEHVVDQCARLIVALLERAEQLTVIATSRAALRVRAERIFLIHPFETDKEPGGVSPATRLFLERCAAVLPDPSSADREAIAEICRRLDGLPLAIELAAERVPVLTPAQMLERLNKPFGFLTGGPRDAPDRQRTLRTTISWSYDLCSPAERQMWRRMAVFLGGWDLDAAERMMANELDGIPALDVLQSLLEKSIVQRRHSNDLVFYDMLNTVRVFGLDASSPEEQEESRSRHLDWYITRLQVLEADWFGPNQAYWLAYARRELPNIRAAYEYCIAMGDVERGAILAVTANRPVWQLQGRLNEWRHWCARLIEIGTPATPEVCQMVCLVGTLDIVFGDLEQGHRLQAFARELAEQVDDDETRYLMTDYEAALSHVSAEESVADHARAFAYQGGRNIVIARSNLEERLVAAHDKAGHIELAARMRESFISRGIEAGEVLESANLLLDAGLAAIGRGEGEKATELLRQSLSLCQSLKSSEAVAPVLEALAHVAAECRDYVRAVTLLGATFRGGDSVGALGASTLDWSSIRVETEGLARRMLGERAYAAALAAGRAMSEAAAVAYALGTQLSPASVPRAGKRGRLTARESQVAALVGQGLSDKEVAERLVISRRTAEGHVANSLAKLGFTSRSQLAIWSVMEAESA